MQVSRYHTVHWTGWTLCSAKLAMLNCKNQSVVTPLISHQPFLQLYNQFIHILFPLSLMKAANRLITLVGFALSSPPPVAGGAEVTDCMILNV